MARYVYSTQKIIDDYKSFNKNQEQYVQAILDNDGKMTPELMKSVELKYKIKRNLDRAHLRLNPTYKDDMLPSDEETSEQQEELGDGIIVDNLYKWCREDNNDITAKILRFLYNINDRISLKDLKEGVNYNGLDESFKSCIKHGQGVRCTYGKLWIVKNNYNEIIMSKKVKDFITNNVTFNNSL